MAGHRMLRSFALPVMQLLKEVKILNENKEWASFEIRISIGPTLYNAETRTFLNVEF